MKRWNTPMLVVLARNHPEEQVLISCKSLDDDDSYKDNYTCFSIGGNCSQCNAVYDS